tara:strand:- start:1815 stop:3257 length:1443 start_codon:yes stop_codon:yes gene_type:complete
MGYREVDSKCGIFVAHSLHDVYNGLKGLQHRGQDSTGIACLTEDGRIDLLRWAGRVDHFDRESASRILDGGILFIGEVRYSTNKGKSQEDLFSGALPRYYGEPLSVTDNIVEGYMHTIVRGASHALVHNGNLIGIMPGEGKTDSDVLLEYYAKSGDSGIENVINTFPASYAAGILDFRMNHVTIFKDRYGIRPLWVGKKDGRLIASSEDRAIIDIGGSPIRELRSGEYAKINQNGTNFESEQVLVKKGRSCFFERHYLGSPLSSFEGMTNQSTRFRLGQILFREFSPEVDIVSYIPNAPEDVARGYAGKGGLPLVNIFYKFKKHRSFLDATSNERSNSIGDNLFVRDNVSIKGKRILVCDDSVVRFNNAPDAVKKLKDQGADYVALAVATPIIGQQIEDVKHYCPFGIDMPEDDNFLGRRQSDLEKMAEEGGFDDIYFISKEGMVEANRISLESCCAFCIGEDNPVSQSELDDLVKLNLS